MASALLSRRVRAVEYIHDNDGQLYRHDFKPGVAARLSSSGGVQLTSRQGRNLWRDFSGRPFLVNPPISPGRGSPPMAKKKKTRRRRSVARRNPPAFLSAAPRRRRRGRAVARRRGGGSRRHARRNPAIGSAITDTLMMAAAAVAGIVLVRTIRRSLLKIQDGTTVASVAEAALGLGIAAFGSKFLPANIAAGMGIGGVVAPLSAFLKQTNLPIVSNSLGDYADTMLVFPKGGTLADYLSPRELSDYAGSGSQPADSNFLTLPRPNLGIAAQMATGILS